jgi:hypothetical protein
LTCFDYQRFHIIIPSSQSTPATRFSKRKGGLFGTRHDDLLTTPSTGGDMPGGGGTPLGVRPDEDEGDEGDDEEGGGGRPPLETAYLEAQLREDPVVFDHLRHRANKASLQVRYILNHS